MPKLEAISTLEAIGIPEAFDARVERVSRWISKAPSLGAAPKYEANDVVETMPGSRHGVRLLWGNPFTVKGR